MISNRFRGLLNLHVLISLTAAIIVLLGYKSLYKFFPVAQLVPSASVLPFLYCVVGGTLFGARYLQSVVSRFHKLNWVDAARLSTWQTATIALCFFAFMFAFKERDMSRIFLGSYLTLLWITFLFLNIGSPRVLCNIFFKEGRRVPTVFVGNQFNLNRLKSWLDTKEMVGLDPLGLVSYSLDDHPTIGGFKNLGNLVKLPEIIATSNIIQVIVLEFPKSEVDARFIIESCQNSGCRLLIHDDLAQRLNHPLITVTEEGHNFFTLQEEPLEDPLNRTVKRTMDLMLAIPVVFLVLPPMFFIVWLVQRIQAPGNLLFIQQRTGYGQNSFRIFKFRSMYERTVEAPSEGRQASRTDERVYSFGRILRKYSLDEFPQFINVLKGEMSVVGPRPHLVAHDSKFEKELSGYRTRFFVKPGITGLAQCNGLRGEITNVSLLSKRVKMDIIYISQWSIWLDIVIVLKTAREVILPPPEAY